MNSKCVFIKPLSNFFPFNCRIRKIVSISIVNKIRNEVVMNRIDTIKLPNPQEVKIGDNPKMLN